MVTLQVENEFSTDSAQFPSLRAPPRNSLSMPDGPEANLSRGRDSELAQSAAAIGT
jgi:hypothetical protein